MSEDYMLIGGDYDAAVSLVNSFRATVRCGRLRPSDQLRKAAQRHAEAVSGGSAPRNGFPEIVWETGYPKVGDGANVEMGVYEATMDQLRSVLRVLARHPDKPGKDFRNPLWDEVGLGAAGKWTVMVFGTRQA